MATRVIDDTKLQNIAVAIQAKDNGGRMTVDEMAGRIDNINNSDPVFEQIVNQTATGIVASRDVKHLLTHMFCFNEGVVGVILNSNPLYIGGSPYNRSPDRMFDSCSNLKFVILPHLTAKINNVFGSYVFLNCVNLKIVILNNMGQNPAGSIYSGAYNISKLVLVSNTIVPLTDTNTFLSSSISNGVCNLYVPDFLKEDYKVATNWSVYANQFKGYSESPDYDTSITYTIGDLCKFNNKLYAWINEVDGNSTPIGNIDDFNNDWYCVADI